MSLPFPKSLDVAPRFLVVGDGFYAEALAAVLKDSALVTKNLLMSEYLPLPQRETGIHPAPLGRVQAVLVVLCEGEAGQSVVWRHRRIWDLPGGMGAAGWLLIAADNKQAEDLQSWDVLGRKPAIDTFSKWNSPSYRIVTREAPLLQMLELLEHLVPVSAKAWTALFENYDVPRNIREFREYLLREDDLKKIAAKARTLDALIPRLGWESFFIGASHSDANAMRNWLHPVTTLDTPWLNEGRSLFSKIQL